MDNMLVYAKFFPQQLPGPAHPAFSPGAEPQQGISAGGEGREHKLADPAGLQDGPRRRIDDFRQKMVVVDMQAGPVVAFVGQGRSGHFAQAEMLPGAHVQAVFQEIPLSGIGRLAHEDQLLEAEGLGIRQSVKGFIGTTFGDVR